MNFNSVLRIYHILTMSHVCAFYRLVQAMIRTNSGVDVVIT